MKKHIVAAKKAASAKKVSVAEKIAEAKTVKAAEKKAADRTKAETATKKTRGRHPGPRPSAGWPKDIAKAAYIAAGGGDAGEKAVRAAMEKHPKVANHTINRWLTDATEFQAALKAATKTTPAPKTEETKSTAKKTTTAKRPVAKKAAAKKAA